MSDHSPHQLLLTVKLVLHFEEGKSEAKDVQLINKVQTPKQMIIKIFKASASLSANKNPELTLKSFDRTSEVKVDRHKSAQFYCVFICSLLKHLVLCIVLSTNSWTQSHYTPPLA